MNDSSSYKPTDKATIYRYFSCLRPQDILVLQGPPLLGAAFGLRYVGKDEVAALAILMIANTLLVAHIFMLNDWAGLTADLSDPNKASRVFTARGVGRVEMTALTSGLLFVSFLLFSRLGPVTLGLSFLIAIASALYSLPFFNWKGRPLLNTAIHLASGIAHVLLGYSLSRAIDGRGVTIAAVFALIFAAGHLNQEVRDHAGDAVHGIRTNAVVFGPRRTFVASLLLFALAHLLLLVLALHGILPRPLALSVVLYPLQLFWSWQAFREGLTYTSVSTLQSRYRVLYAVIGLAMLIMLVNGHGKRWW